MKKTIRITVFLMFLCLWSMKVYGVSLDGYYGDWNDKPFITDPVGDGDINQDLIQVGWYPDIVEHKLYLYLKRSNKYKPGKWDSYIDITVGTEIYYININSNTNSGKVGVWLYNKSKTLLWYGSGYWCDNLRVEFYIPLNGIVDTGGAGYSMEVNVFTSSDRVPDQGNIIISTISTYPMFTLIISGLIIILTYIKRRKGGRYDFFGIAACAR